MMTELAMDGMTAVRQAVDRLLAGALEPVLDLLAEDVEFQVAERRRRARTRAKAWGKEPVAEYFTALGGLTAFWQIDYTAKGGQVIAWGKESFTVEPCGLEGGCEFALVFEVEEGMVRRFSVIEDLGAYFPALGDIALEPHGGASQPLEPRIPLERREHRIDPEPPRRQIVRHLEQRLEPVERLLRLIQEDVHPHELVLEIRRPCRRPSRSAAATGRAPPP